MRRKVLIAAVSWITFAATASAQAIAPWRAPELDSWQQLQVHDALRLRQLASRVEELERRLAAIQAQAAWEQRSSPPPPADAPAYAPAQATIPPLLRLQLGGQANVPPPPVPAPPQQWPQPPRWQLPPVYSTEGSWPGQQTGFSVNDSLRRQLELQSLQSFRQSADFYRQAEALSGR